MNWTNRLRGLWLLATIPFLFHCGDDGTEDTDSGVLDASIDGAVEDAGFDAGPEDAGFDAGPEDAGFDAGPADAGFDAGPPEPTLPLAVDEWFPGRASFSSADGTPLHTEDNTCPERAGDMAGDCHHIVYTGGDGAWSGDFWIDGTGFDSLSSVAVEAGATEVSFWAWGAAGGEVITFGAGIAGNDGGEDRREITLSTTPTEFIVPLALLQGYTEVWGAFVWSIGGDSAEFYIDDIQWVVGDALTPLTLPMTVDDYYPSRSAFGDNAGAPWHSETAGCATRAGGMNGQCHTFAWDGSGGYTGTFWTDGEAFTNLVGKSVDPGANVVRFYAWGASGGEVVEFGAGVSGWDVGEDRQLITLSTTPTEYTVSLTANASYASVFGPFIWVATSGNNPTGLEFYVDDIQWATVAIPVDLRPDAADRVIAWGGGTPVLNDAAIGGANVGDAEGASVYVVPFVLPALPAGGFTDANFNLNVIAVAGDGSATDLHADLYGLPFRTAAAVAAGEVVETSMFYSSDTVDSAATLLVDDFLTGASVAGSLDTDAAGDAAIVSYLNAQVTAGAVAGDYVYLRLSPDATPGIPAGYTWVVTAAVDDLAPPERPTLTVQ